MGGPERSLVATEGEEVTVTLEYTGQVEEVWTGVVGEDSRFLVLRNEHGGTFRVPMRHAVALTRRGG